MNIYNSVHVFPLFLPSAEQRSTAHRLPPASPRATCLAPPPGLATRPALPLPGPTSPRSGLFSRGHAILTYARATRALPAAATAERRPPPFLRLPAVPAAPPRCQPSPSAPPWPPSAHAPPLLRTTPPVRLGRATRRPSGRATPVAPLALSSPLLARVRGDTEAPQPLFLSPPSISLRSSASSSPEQAPSAAAPASPSNHHLWSLSSQIGSAVTFLAPP